MKPRTLIALAAAFVLAGVGLAIDFGGLSKAMDGLNKAKKVKEDVDDVKTLVSDVSPEEEQALGDSVALEIISRYGGLVRDPAMMRRVNLVGRGLVRYSSRPDNHWRFGVLNSDTVNAFSAPDGYVFISRGLYKLADTDDALAGVLGHEISHITGRDAIRIIGNSKKGSIITRHAAEHSSDLRQVQAAAQQLDVSVDKIIQTLFDKGYSTTTEYAADKNGHDLAATTGYAPGGLRSVLKVLQARGGETKKVFPSHPPLAERIQRLPDDPAPAPAS